MTEQSLETVAREQLELLTRRRDFLRAEQDRHTRAADNIGHELLGVCAAIDAFKAVAVAGANGSAAPGPKRAPKGSIEAAIVAALNSVSTAAAPDGSGLSVDELIAKTKLNRSSIKGALRRMQILADVAEANGRWSLMTPVPFERPPYTLAEPAPRPPYTLAEPAPINDVEDVQF